jgi:hypothetical protein
MGIPATTGMLTPTTYEGAVQFSETLAASSMVPAAFKNKPGDILVAVQWGSEIGLPPMQALQGIAVINGKPAIYGDAMMALVTSHPEYGGHQENIEGEEATCTIVRVVKGRDVVTTRTFSVGDAKRANLWSKRGPWSDYPKRMLQMRARGFAVRDAFPDALKGVISREEAEDIPNNNKYKDVTPANPLDAIAAPKPGKETGEDHATEAPEVIDDLTVPEGTQTFEASSKPPVEEIDPDAPAWELIMPNDGAIDACGSVTEWIATFTDVVNRIADDGECVFTVRRHDIAEFKKANNDTIDRVKDEAPAMAEQLAKDYRRLIRMLSAKAKEAGE